VEQGPCQHCRTAPVTGRKRKYCDEHSRQASAIWKRRNPELRGSWKNPEDRKAYFRTYMREYRRRKRTPKTATPEGGEAVCSHST
jgi:hypothetical protein